VLVSSDEQKQMLEDSGFVWNPLPLFPEEVDEIPEDATIVFEGDSHGTFVHAFLTGPAINFNRELWIEGSEDQEPFEVIKVIEPPERYATEQSWLDVDAMADDGFWLEPTQNKGSSSPSIQAKAVAKNACDNRWLGVFFPTVTAICGPPVPVPDREITISVIVEERGDGLQWNTGTRAAVRAWKKEEDSALNLSVFQGIPGKDGARLIEFDGCRYHSDETPIVPAGASVWVQVGTRWRVGKLDETGEATFTIPIGTNPLDTLSAGFIALENNAVSLRYGPGPALESRQPLFNENYRLNENIEIERCLSNRDVYTFSMLTDAWMFAKYAFDWEPKRAKTLYVPERLSSRAVVPAMSLFRSPHLAGFRQLFTGPLTGNPDIVLPVTTATERVTLYHEYGHWVMATILSETSPLGFDTIWQLTIFQTLSDPDRRDQIRRIRADVEGFADFFSSQATGGTNYLQPGGAIHVDDGDNSICVGDSQDPCVEDNFGGPLRPNSGFPEQVEAQIADSLIRDSAQVTSLLLDAVDGVVAATAQGLNSGVLWSYAPNSSSNLIRWHGGDRDDEAVTLSGGQIVEAIKDWGLRNTDLLALQFWRLHESLTLEARDSHSASEVCEWLALHSRNARCEDLVDFGPEVIGQSASAPKDVQLLKWLDASTMKHNFLVIWSGWDDDIERAQVRITSFGEDLKLDERLEDPRAGNLAIWGGNADLEFDAEFKLKLTHISGDGRSSAPYSSTFRSDAEPPHDFTLFDVDNDWIVASWSSEATMWRLELEHTEEDWSADFITAGQFFIRPLEDVFDDEASYGTYELKVYAINAEGKETRTPSQTLTFEVPEPGNYIE
jgi:hypothetical protein